MITSDTNYHPSSIFVPVQHLEVVTATKKKILPLFPSLVIPAAKNKGKIQVAITDEKYTGATRTAVIPLLTDSSSASPPPFSRNYTSRDNYLFEGD